jgi:peptidoglycan/xylan/chitin deacetylase (PgdA/CDA1 family)
MNLIALMYHDVVPAGAEDSSGFPGRDAALYKLDPRAFARHLDAIARHAPANPMRVVDLRPGMRSTAPALTFDDGGQSARFTADALEQRGWRGHFFVTAGCVGRPAFLTPGDLRELHNRGHVIGSHSYSHPLRMAQRGRVQLLEEWTRSVATIEDALGEPVLAASIPGGAYSTAVADTAAQAGIAMLFTSEPTERSWSVDGALVFGRYTIQRWMGPRTVAGLMRGHRAPRVSQWVVWNGKKLTKAICGRSYLRVRSTILRAKPIEISPS